MRTVVRMSVMRPRRAAGVSHGAAVIGHVRRAPVGARDQRAQRPRAVNVVEHGQKSWRRLRLLFGQVVTYDPARRERLKKLSHQSAVDALALRWELVERPCMASSVMWPL